MKLSHSNRNTLLFIKLFLFSSLAFLTGCGGSSEAISEPEEYSVTTASSGSGIISPAEIISESGRAVTFTLAPSEGYRVATATGCNRLQR